MRRLAATAILLLAAGFGPAQAFEADVQGVLDGLKRGKPVPITDIATLMRGSERWCYRQADGACAWSDIYLEVTDKGAIYEIGNAWDAQYNVLMTDQGEFRDNRFICEVGHDWVPSVRAFHRIDGSPVGGRELFALKQAIRSHIADDRQDCFAYQLQDFDTGAGTITLLQRQYPEGSQEPDPAQDTPVTLHFDPASAAALTWSL